MAVYQGNQLVSNVGGSYLPYDAVPMQGSDKLVLSGGVADALTQDNLRRSVFGAAAIGNANRPIYIAANGVPTAMTDPTPVSVTITPAAGMTVNSQGIYATRIGNRRLVCGAFYVSSRNWTTSTTTIGSVPSGYQASSGHYFPVHRSFAQSKQLQGWLNFSGTNISVSLENAFTDNIYCTFCYFSVAI